MLIGLLARSHNSTWSPQRLRPAGHLVQLRQVQQQDECGGFLQTGYYGNGHENEIELQRWYSYSVSSLRQNGKVSRVLILCSN